jgi:hypothetical protein
MAVREGDVEVFRSGMSSLLEGALQQEAAFNDPFTQAMKLGREISETYKTAMQIKPKFDDFMEGIRGQGTVGPEADSVLKSSMSTGDFQREMAKQQLGSAYMENVEYEMDAVTGQYKPVVSQQPFGTFGEVDMSLKTPTGKFPDQSRKVADFFGRRDAARSEEQLQVSIMGIANAANAINSGQTSTASAFTDGKINIGSILGSARDYLRNTFYEEDPVTGELRERL